MWKNVKYSNVFEKYRGDQYQKSEEKTIYDTIHKLQYPIQVK